MIKNRSKVGTTYQGYISRKDQNKVIGDNLRQSYKNKIASKLHLVCIYVASKLHLNFFKVASILHLNCIQIAFKLHLDCI